MRAAWALVALGAAILSWACGGGDGSGGPSFEAGRNIAVLDGVPLGTGATAHAELRKSLRVSIANPVDELEVETAWALRPRTFDQSMLLLIEVTNVGAAPRCFIEVDALTFLDAEGAALAPSEGSWVFGSVGDVGRPGQPVYSDTCLGVDETGYILHVVSAETGGSAYDRVSEATFGWTLHEHEPVRTPDPIVQAQSYEPLPTGDVRVHFTNSGTRAADLTNHFTRMMLLDDEGSPLWWGFAVDAFSPADLLLAPGDFGSADETDTFRLYSGQGSRVRVYINFEVPPSGSALRSEPTKLDVREILRERSSVTHRLLFR